MRSQHPAKRGLKSQIKKNGVFLVFPSGVLKIPPVPPPPGGSGSAGDERGSVNAAQAELGLLPPSPAAVPGGRASCSALSQP